MSYMPPPVPRYYWPYAFLLLAVAGPLGYIYSLHNAAPAPLNLAAASAPEVQPRVNWYLMVQLPEITTQYESGVETMKARLEDWLKACKDAGYKPMLLSDVLENLSRGAGVPEKTMVFLFNPGYRRTYRLVSPILERHKVPAVWISDNQAMRRADRRLVTYHDTRSMKASGLWDVGFLLKSGELRLESPRGARLSFGGSGGPLWTPEAGAFAVNSANHGQGFHFLTANSAWLAGELVGRLRVETPATGLVRLAKGRIQGYDWGVALPADEAEESRFSLQAPASRRGLKLFWLSTQSSPDFRLHVKVDSLTGEFWTRLRRDESSGYALSVSYDNKVLAVNEQSGSDSRVLFMGPCPRPSSGRGFVQEVTLAGRRLFLTVNNVRVAEVEIETDERLERGPVEIYISDKIQGVAAAEGIEMSFEPLRSRESKNPLLL